PAGAAAPAPGDPASATSPTGSAAIAALGPDERRALGLIAAAAAPLGTDHIETILDLDDAGPVCARLEDAGLIRSASPRFVLTEPLSAEQLADLDVPRYRRSLTEHLATWVEQNRNSPRRIVRDLDVLLSVLGSAADGAGREASGLDAPAALRIAHGAESALLLAKRWRRW